MVFNRSLLASLPRKTLLAALVVLALAGSGLAQDPTAGRPERQEAPCEEAGGQDRARAHHGYADHLDYSAREHCVRQRRRARSDKRRRQDSV